MMRCPHVVHSRNAGHHCSGSAGLLYLRASGSMISGLMLSEPLIIHRISHALARHPHQNSLLGGMCRALLGRMSPEHKFATAARLSGEVMASFAEGSLPLPAASEVLADALRILCSPAIKVHHPSLGISDSTPTPTAAAAVAAAPHAAAAPFSPGVHAQNSRLCHEFNKHDCAMQSVSKAMLELAEFTVAVRQQSAWTPSMRLCVCHRFPHPAKSGVQQQQQQ